jgi:transposase-like protein
MSGVRFSDEQIKHFLSMPIVAKATPKMLVFTQQFKQLAVTQVKNGKTIRLVLQEAGIDTALFSRDYLYAQLKSWRKQDLDNPPKPKGRPKGPPPAPENAELTKEQLLTKIALLNAENDFLKKVRAPRTSLSETCTGSSLGRQSKD